MPRPGEHLRLHPLLHDKCMETKKKSSRSKLQKKIQLSDKEIANLSDAQFKTLVIRMLQELTEYFSSIKKTKAAMKVALCEIKKNLQGTNSDGKETGTQISSLE